MYTLKLRPLWLCLGLIWVALVVCLSLVSQPVHVLSLKIHASVLLVPGLPPDKTFHLTAYFLMMGWFSMLTVPSRHLRLVAAFFLLGCCLECIQFFVPMRSFDLLDILANAAGLFAAWFAARTPVARLLLAVEKNLLKTPS